MYCNETKPRLSILIDTLEDCAKAFVEGFIRAKLYLIKGTDHMWHPVMWHSYPCTYCTVIHCIQTLPSYQSFLDTQTKKKKKLTTAVIIMCIVTCTSAYSKCAVTYMLYVRTCVVPVSPYVARRKYGWSHDIRISRTLLVVSISAKASFKHSDYIPSPANLQ